MSLIEFCAALAIDPALFARYLAAPAQVAAQLGLADETHAVLSSGDRTLIAAHFAEISTFNPALVTATAVFHSSS